MIYFNEFEPFAAEWLGNLFPESTIDTRSIKDVKAEDVRGFRRVHFFGGIGGWEQALQLAGWPVDRSVWTGSCPCQPFSSAGKGKGSKDERHLWPEFFRLIRECKPSVIFGEQVASSEVVGTEHEAAFVIAVQSGDFARANKIAKELVKRSGFGFDPRWLDGVFADLEGEGYTCGAVVLGAHSVGAPHIRQRLYWVAHSGCHGNERRGETGDISSSAAAFKTEAWKRERSRNAVSDSGPVKRLALPNGRGPHRREDSAGTREQGIALQAETGCIADRLAESDSPEFQREPSAGEQSVHECGGAIGPLVNAFQSRLEGHTGDGDRGDESGRIGTQEAGSVAEAGSACGMGDTDSDGREQGITSAQANGYGSSADSNGGSDFWSDFRIIPCKDGKSRRIGRSVFPLVNGIPRDMGRGQPELGKLVRGARANRVGRLKGYGNSIVPQVAAEFIRAFMESELASSNAPASGRGE